MTLSTVLLPKIPPVRFTPNLHPSNDAKFNYLENLDPFQSSEREPNMTSWIQESEVQAEFKGLGGLD